MLALWLAGCRNAPPTSDRTPTAPTALPAATATATAAGVLLPTEARATSAPSEAPQGGTPPTAVPTELIVGGLALPQDIAWTSASGDGSPLAMLLHRWLSRSLLDAVGNPEVAASWTMEGDRARFTLAADARWSDGTPMRAADVVRLLQQAAEAGNLPQLRSVTAPNATTVEVTVAAPNCPALSAVATWPMLPDDAWPPERTSGLSITRLATDEWQLGEHIRYRRYPDERALRNAWERNDITAVVGANRLTEGPLAGPGVAVNEAGPLLATLLFRMGDPLVGDVGLREALTLATDRAALYEAAYGAAPSALLRALLPSGHWADPTEALPTADPRVAMQQLEQLGWRDRDGDGIREDSSGTSLAIVLSMPLSGDGRWEALGQALKAQWREVGVDVQLLYLESFALQERLHTERWQVALLAYSVTMDPDQSAMWAVPAEGDIVGDDLNITGYANGAVAELMRQGAQVRGCSPADRAQFYREAWAILLTERPIWPLFALPLDVALRPEVSLDP